MKYAFLADFYIQNYFKPELQKYLDSFRMLDVDSDEGVHLACAKLGITPALFKTRYLDIFDNLKMNDVQQLMMIVSRYSRGKLENPYKVRFAPYFDHDMSTLAWLNHVVMRIGFSGFRDRIYELFQVGHLNSVSEDRLVPLEAVEISADGESVELGSSKVVLSSLDSKKTLSFFYDLSGYCMNCGREGKDRRKRNIKKYCHVKGCITSDVNGLASNSAEHKEGCCFKAWLKRRKALTNGLIYREKKQSKKIWADNDPEITQIREKMLYSKEEAITWLNQRELIGFFDAFLKREKEHISDSIERQLPLNDLNLVDSLLISQLRMLALTPS